MHVGYGLRKWSQTATCTLVQGLHYTFYVKISPVNATPTILTLYLLWLKLCQL